MKSFKLFCLLVALTLGFQNIHAQPQRVGKTDVYFELIVEGGDTTIRFTGKGKLENNNWTKYRKNIKHVVIEEGITEIIINAFSSCKKLTTVSLPQSLKIIENNHGVGGYLEWGAFIFEV